MRWGPPLPPTHATCSRRSYNASQSAYWNVTLRDKLKIARCGMHAFRHTHASLIVAAGASPAVAQRQLRHSDVSTTLGHYTHLIGNDQRDVAEKVAEQLRPNATNATMLQSQIQWTH